MSRQLGTYRLDGMLGRGGMGEVHRAWDERRERWVALKLLDRAVGEDPDFRRRFRREARTVGRLSDPHVIPVHDFGEIDGQLFLDMRLVEGTDLAGELRRIGALTAARTVALLGQVAAALHAAHGAGLVHRDVKPSNVLLDADDFVYVVDFGLARTRGTASDLDAGSVVGTLAYMAPERLRGEPAEVAADVYALGCVLHECLTGRRPFPTEDASELVAAQLHAPPPAPSVTVPSAAAFDDIVARTMDKEPAGRYATTAEVAGAMAAALPAVGSSTGSPATSTLRGPTPTLRGPPDIPAPRDAPAEERRPGAAARPWPDSSRPRWSSWSSWPGSSAPGSPWRWSSSPGSSSPGPWSSGLGSSGPGSSGLGSSWLGRSPLARPALLGLVLVLVIVVIAVVGRRYVGDGIAIGLSPVAVAVTADGAAAVVVDAGSPVVPIVDTRTRSVVTRVVLGAPAVSAVADASTGRLFVVTTAGRTRGSLSVIDLRSASVAATIPLLSRGTGQPAASPDGTEIYVPGERAVQVVDVARGRVRAEYPGAVTSIAADPGGRRLYTVVGGRTAVVVTDPATGAALGTIRLAAPARELRTGSDGRLYVTGDDPARALSVIDTGARRVVDVVALPSPATGFAVSADGRRAYVAVGSVGGADPWLAAVDTASSEVVGRYFLEPYTGRVAIAVAPRGTPVYVANTDLGTLTVDDVALLSGR